MGVIGSRYPAEFRESAVCLALARKADGGSYIEVARELGLHKSTLLGWIKAEQVELGVRPGLSRDERDELKELRKKVARLERDREILGKAAAFFAQEGRYNR